MVNIKKVKLLGKRERDVLKYRSYEIMLYLFYVEDLKKFIVQSLQTTNDIFGVSNKKLKLDDHLNRIVEDGIITAQEKVELVTLIDIRNDISHEVHKMVNDLGDTSQYQLLNEEGKIKTNYQYGALYRLKVISAKIHRGFQSQYAMMSSFDKFIFEPAEKALEYEMDIIFRRMLKVEVEKLYDGDQ